MYVASFPFKYCGQALLSGQVLERLDGVVGDLSLTSLQYLREAYLNQHSKRRLSVMAVAGSLSLLDICTITVDESCA